MLLALRCRRCTRTFARTHFAKNRKSCRTCLEGAPLPPQSDVLSDGTPVFGWVRLAGPRAVRRWWPEYVILDRAPRNR